MFSSLTAGTGFPAAPQEPAVLVPRPQPKPGAPPRAPAMPPETTGGPQPHRGGPCGDPPAPSCPKPSLRPLSHPRQAPSRAPPPAPRRVSQPGAAPKPGGRARSASPQRRRRAAAPPPAPSPAPGAEVPLPALPRAAGRHRAAEPGRLRRPGGRGGERGGPGSGLPGYEREAGGSRGGCGAARASRGPPPALPGRALRRRWGRPSEAERSARRCPAKLS